MRWRYVPCAVMILMMSCDDEPDPGDFGAACAVNEDCNDPLICYAFNEGSQCTVECPSTGVCPEGSSGCNNMDPSVCKTK